METKNNSLFFGFLFILVVLISLGTLSAQDTGNNTQTAISTDVSCDSSINENIADTKTQEVQTSINTKKENTQEIVKQTNKNVVKNTNQKTVQTKQVLNKESTSKSSIKTVASNKTSTVKKSLKSEGTSGTFTDLKDTIDKNTDITLYKSYTRNVGEDTIEINKKLSIDGKGYIIDANKQNGTFVIGSSADVTLKNIIFKNYQGTISTQESSITVNGGKLTLINVTFTDNAGKNGGAIYNTGNLYITNSTFLNNSATYWGGAICNNGTSDTELNIQNSTFENNIATTPKNGQGMGGAICTSLSKLTINATKFINNTAALTESNGGNGGAIYAEDTTNPIVITNSTFDKCVSRYGAALVINNYHSSCDTLADVNITNCNFTDNEGLHGATYFLNTTVNIEDSLFKNNQATYLRSDKQDSSGGAVCFGYSSKCNINNSVFKNNSAVGRGGAVYGSSSSPLVVNNSVFENNYLLNQESSYSGAIDTPNNTIISNSVFKNNSAVYGGAICNSGNLNITNNTFIDNSATKGGSIFNYGTDNVLNIQNATFNNNTAIDNGGAIYSSSTGDLIINNTVFGNNTVINETVSYGGAVDTHTPTKIGNSTFINNTAIYGGAVSVDKSLDLENSVFTNNTASDKGAALYSTNETNNLVNNTYNNNIALNSGDVYKNNNEVISTTTTINSRKDGNIIYINGTTTNVISGTEVDVLIDGQKNTVVVDDNGFWSTSFTNVNAGNQEIRVNYNGDNDHNSFSITNTLNIQNPTSITASWDDKIYSGIQTCIIGTLTDEYTGKAISGATITVKIGDETNNGITDVNGSYNISITMDKANLYEINVTYGGSTYYEHNTYQSTINVLKRTTKLTIDDIDPTKLGKNITVKVTLTEDDGTVLSGKDVTITINGNDIPVKTGDDGVATINYTTTKVGILKITAEFAGDDDVYNSSTANNYVQILQLDTIVSINDVTTKINDTTTIIINVSDENGIPVNDGKVILKVNGKSLRDSEGNIVFIEVNDGVAEYKTSFNLNAKPYYLTSTYSGSQNYTLSKSNVAILTVTKRDATLSIYTNTSVIATGETVKITVKITDENRLVNSGKVIFKLNGRTLRDSNGQIIYKIVSEGIVTFEYTVPSEFSTKSYNLAAVYGDKSYNRAEESTSIIIVKSITKTVKQVTATNNNLVADNILVNIAMDNITESNPVTNSTVTLTNDTTPKTVKL